MIASNGRLPAAPSSSSSDTTQAATSSSRNHPHPSLNPLCSSSATSSAAGVGAGPLMRGAGSLQLSQLCNASQQYPLLALQQNFSHLLPPNYAEAAAAAASAAAAVQQHQHQQHQQQQHHHHQQQQHQLHQQLHQHPQQPQSHQQQHLPGQPSSLSHHHHNSIGASSSSSQHRYHQQPYFHQHHHHHGFDSTSQLGAGGSSSSSNSGAAAASNNNSGANHEHNNPSHLYASSSSTSSSRTHHNWRKSKPTSSNNAQQSTNGPSSASLQQKQRLGVIHDHYGSPHTLLDLSAKIVAEHIPFQSIEQRYEHIPEPVQRRIIFWSFPRHEDDIKMYSSLSSDTFNGNGPQSSSSSSNNNNSSTTSNNTTQSPSSNNNAFAWIGDHQAANATLQQQQTSNQHISTTSQNSNKNSTNNKLLTFHKGLRLYNENCVQAVLQVGFNLSGLINIKSIPGNLTTSINSKIRGSNNNHSSNNNNIINHNNANHNNHMDVQNNNLDLQANHMNQVSSSNSNDNTNSTNDHLSKNYRVSVTFDRCKITSVSCSCELQDIFWCEHVVALILYRIRNPDTIELRVPISETLLSLDRHQLQKLVQYIIAEHHTEVLPTAQRLLDEMRQSFSKINQIHGAPDPTAGACADDEHIWHLDEHQVNEKVQNNLNLVQSNSKDAAKQIIALFEKIREMFRAKDSNGTRLLKLITEQFLTHATRNEKSRPLWDQLVSLWVVVMLNPDLPKADKNNFTHLLNGWSRVAKCPKEDVERRISTKRKAAELSDDEDSNDYLNSNDYPISFNQSNNYPAHMATHRHRAFQSSSCFPVLRSYNQLPILPSTCPCQLSHSIAKKMRSHHMQHNNESFNSSSRNYRPPSSYNHQPASRDNVGQPANAPENRLSGPQEPRSVFFRALDFQNSSWDDTHLQFILNKDGPVDFDAPYKSNMSDFTGNPLWSEPVSQAAARIETLRSHGYREQALRLTVATVRRLKLHQDQWRISTTSDPNSEAPCLSKGIENYTEGWIGHPFDPINVLIDLLLEASLTEVKSTMGSGMNNTGLCTVNSSRCSCPYNQAIAEFTHRLLPDLASLSNRVDGFPILPLVNLAPRRLPGSPNQTTSDKTLYYHVPVPGCCQKDSYLTLAVELALIALGQQRSIPTIATAQDRAVRQESELISKLESIDTSDPHLVDILKYQTTLLLKGGPFQNSCCGVPADSAPLHTYARYLFDSLVSHYPQLAYEVGIHALKTPLLLDENGENFGAVRAPSRSINHNHLQSEQLALAQTMLSKAKDESQQAGYLRKIHRASVKNIRNPASLLKLSKHVSKEAKPSSTTLYPALLKTSFDFTLQVLKMTMSPHISNSKTRKDAIQFITECATDIGLEAVAQVMKDWKDHFSATEALNLVVARENGESASITGNLRSQAISKLKLKEHPIREAELNRRSRDLVLDCANRDPSSCALEALKFCEIEEDSLKKALKIVIDAGTNGTMDSSQLIRVADYIDERGMTDKAFDIAMVAVDSLSIPSNSDNSSSKKDIVSACVYAQKVNGFSTLIPKLIENIECATVLSEIYDQFNSKLHLAPNYSLHTADMYRQGAEDARCWERLLKRTLKAFVDTTRTRLQNISPRHYEEFIEFLGKAENTFKMASDGPQQFKDLISEIMKNYRTKKKLMERLKARFDYSNKTSL